MVEVLQRTGDRLDAATLYELLALRSEVFVVEQASAYQDLDGRDLVPSTVHLWCRDERGVTAAVRLLVEPDGRRRVGRVVTRRDARSQGLARHLIGVAIDLAGPVETVLSAQAHLQRFYEELGYQVDGPGFVEDGIPHLPMRRPPGPGSVGPGGPG